jgi:DNA-binding MarR family transcriptional regulator
MTDHDHVQHVLGQWRREAPGLDRSPMAVIGRITRLAQLLEGEQDPLLEAHGVTGGEFDVLAALRRSGRPYHLTPTALSRALLVTSGGMTKRLAALEARGLIERRPDPSDGRSSTVTLTRPGKRLFDAALAEHVANQQRLVAGLDPDEREQLASLLERFAVLLGDRADSRPRRRAPIS